MRNQKRKSLNWLLFLSGGLFIGGLLYQSRERKGTFPQIKSVQKGLAELYGELDAAFFVGKLRQRYEVLYAERPRFGDRKLQTHVDELIIPVLALYQRLMEKTGDSERSLKEVHDLMLQVVIGKSRVIVPLLGKFSDPFSMLTRAVKFINRTAFPAPGWEIEYIQEDQAAIAFNIHDCFVMNVLSAYGVPELTKVFCQFDDDVAELFPAGILWVRESTIAQGAKLCDFRYERNVSANDG